METNSINIIDDFFSYEDLLDINNFCKNAVYVFGSKDAPDLPPTGMTHTVQPDTKIYDLFKSSTEKLVGDHLLFHSILLNCFAPNENAYFHTDFPVKECVTFIYYPNIEWCLDWGGETQFFINEEIRGILPKPNRMIYYDSNILHKATPYRDRHRFTFAVKYVAPEYSFLEQFKNH